MEERKNWDLLAIASIPLIMTLGNSMLIPVLPAIRSKLGISSLQVSLLITIYSGIAIILIPLAGYLSDRFGRKKIIIPSLIITGVGGLIAGLGAWWLDQSYLVIMLGRLLQGVGASGAFPIVLPLVGDMFKKDSDVSSSLGLVETANTFGKVLSPILGSALALISWFLPFMSIPVFCVISTILVACLVKTPKKEDSETNISFSEFIQDIKQLFKDNGRWLYAIFTIGCICMLVIFGVLFYLSDTLEEKYHLDGIVKGLVLAIPLAALCLASYIIGKTIGRNMKLMKWIAFAGILLVTISLFLNGLVHSLKMLITLISFGGIGIGVALPCLDALITENIEKPQRGTITSIYSSMRFIGVAAGPPLASILVKFSPQLMFYSIGGTGVIAAILALFAIKPDCTKQAG
ncbi:MFS transporter [Paenibacillus sp. GCM10023248]|uniref:MFS transporter n=1 Tax=unclassified Paenibacillus TaxID=185978 RepID=UPI0023795189|nr:MFS transporter [Paenibacillus sp. MAHUQ-63]MDD9270543.1 MFS transporter [Paenibacillus sp. MAHUQ-63]